MYAASIVVRVGVAVPRRWRRPRSAVRCRTSPPPARSTSRITQGTSMAAAASPDRRSIAIDLLGGIWILPFRGGEAKRITPELLEARQPTWSPDSQSIAFQGYDDGAWHIYVIPRDGGEAKAITSGPVRRSRAGLVARRIAHRVLVGSLRRHHHHLGRRRRQRRGRQISKRDGWMPAWSPDDQEITFVSADARSARRATRSPGLWAVEPGRPRAAPDPVDRRAGRQRRRRPRRGAPDGTQLAYVAAAALSDAAAA